MTRRLLGRITRRPGSRPIASTPEEGAAMAPAPEPAPPQPPRRDPWSPPHWPDEPHLCVWKGDDRWRWYVANHPSLKHSDRTNDDGHATHAEALAVGLAALEAATIRAHELSAGWEKITT